MLMRLVAANFCVVAALFGTAAAGVREDAVSAYQRGDFASAFRHWLTLAEQGEGSAQMMLGFMYHDGEGVPKDYVRAYMWFYLAASNLIANGQEFRDAIEARDLTAKAMSPAQIELAKEMARRCQGQDYKDCN